MVKQFFRERRSEMGRPSLAAIRREQILDAVERCMLEHGLSGTTLQKIAERAEVQPSLIAHYFGNKDEVVGAAIARTLGRFRDGFADATRNVPPARRLDALLDALFSGRMATSEYALLVDALIADSYFNESTKLAVRAMYADF